LDGVSCAIGTVRRALITSPPTEATPKKSSSLAPDSIDMLRELALRVTTGSETGPESNPILPSGAAAVAVGSS